jgi:hypothetical protein
VSGAYFIGEEPADLLRRQRDAAHEKAITLQQENAELCREIVRLAELIAQLRAEGLK